MGVTFNSVFCRLCEGPLSAAPLAAFDCVDLTLHRCPSCGLVQLGEDPAPAPASVPAPLPAALAKAMAKSLPVHARVAVIDESPNRPFMCNADAVLLRQVVERTTDFEGLFARISIVSDMHTRLIIETPDLRLAAAAGRYGLIRHTAPNYFDAGSLECLLDRFGWALRGAVTLGNGNLVVWAARHEHRDASWVFPLEGNVAAPLPESGIRQFAASWQEACAQTRRTIESLVAAGEKLAAYGSAEDVTAVLGPAGLAPSWIHAIYDPAVTISSFAALPQLDRIPVVSPSLASMDSPSTLLVADRAEEAAIERGTSRLRRIARRFLSIATLPMRPIELAAPGQPRHPEAA